MNELIAALQANGAPMVGIVAEWPAKGMFQLYEVVQIEGKDYPVVLTPIPGSNGMAFRCNPYLNKR